MFARNHECASVVAAIVAAFAVVAAGLEQHHHWCKVWTDCKLHAIALSRMVCLAVECLASSYFLLQSAASANAAALHGEPH